VAHHVDEHTIRVLVADDDPDAREMYGTYLRRVGMQVETAADGDEALRMAAAFAPDVIVMDLAMPFVTGDEAASQIRADARLSEARIIGLTAYGVLARTTARVAPFDAFYRKPLLPRDLAVAVEGLVFRQDRKRSDVFTTP
jgi:CheY-like chemotaxis protein